MRRMILASASVSVLLVVASTTLGGVKYKVTDLGTLGGAVSDAFDINNSGQIVGETRNSSNNVRAFRFSSGSMTDLGSVQGNPGNTVNSACGINASGQVAGYTLLQSGSSPPIYAFRYTNGTLTNLGTVPGTSYTCSTAYGINDGGQVAGACLMGYSGIYPVYHAFLYSNGTMTDLGAPSGYPSIKARAINNAGMVVGSMMNASNTITRAFLYNGGSITDIGTLSSYAQADARAINASGQVAGYCYTPDQGGHGYLYTAGTMTDLGTLGGSVSFANDVNAGGLVVGASYYMGGGFTTRAFLYSNGTMTDLNDSLVTGSQWTLTTAYAINDNGWIVGSGINSSGQSHAFLLTPIPEPSTLALLGIGAISLLTFTCVKRRLNKTRL
jgi:probable HAF family extracellular repeat protein